MSRFSNAYLLLAHFLDSCKRSINWVKQVGSLLPDTYEPEKTPQVGELDELETFVGSKKRKFGFGQQ